MYLSDRDLFKAIDSGQLIVRPRPPDSHIGSTSIDLQLDNVNEAKIWNIDAYQNDNCTRGDQPRELRIGKFDYRIFSPKYLIAPSEENSQEKQLVFRRGHEIVIRPGALLLWQTKEIIGTPLRKSKYICFIDGKSTRARTGLLVHLTALTIHANWSGNVTLEIANLGPFDFVLAEGDVIAQITVARISSRPLHDTSITSSTLGQQSVMGRPNVPPQSPNTISIKISKDRRKKSLKQIRR